MNWGFSWRSIPLPKNWLTLGLMTFTLMSWQEAESGAKLLNLVQGKLKISVLYQMKGRPFFTKLFKKKRKKENLEFEPLDDGSWPEIDFGDTENQLLAKYSDDELIILASRNPGYGFRDFMKQLYPKGEKTSNRNTKVMRFLKEIENEDGINYYDLLQDPSKVSWSTKDEYKRLLGKSIFPLDMLHGSAGGKNRNWIQITVWFLYPRKVLIGAM